MKVVTLDEVDFDDACKRLASQALLVVSPLAIVGIRTGGYVVAEKMVKHLKSSDSHVLFYGVTASRTTSNIKNKLKVHYFFKLLPTPVLNVMRLIEHFFLSIQMYCSKSSNRHIEISSDLQSYLKGLSGGEILVVDDAIDSGATVNGVLARLNELNPRLTYYVAVLVVTQSSPSVLPDVNLYENILLRFPWANDFRS